MTHWLARCFWNIVYKGVLRLSKRVSLVKSNLVHLRGVWKVRELFNVLSKHHGSYRPLIYAAGDHPGTWPTDATSHHTGIITAASWRNVSPYRDHHSPTLMHHHHSSARSLLDIAQPTIIQSPQPVNSTFREFAPSTDDHLAACQDSITIHSFLYI